MTTEQAQQRLEEIRRLLMEKDKAEQVVKAIDEQINELAGVEQESRPTTRKPLTRNRFRSLCGVPT